MGPFQWADPMTTDSYGLQKTYDTRSHTVIIPQECKNTHQSFGAPSSFDPPRRIITFPAKCTAHQTTITVRPQEQSTKLHFMAI